METGYCLSLSLEAREEYIERILQLKREKTELIKKVAQLSRLNEQLDAIPRWISVEERLPEDNKNVIVFVQHPISGHHLLQIAHMLRVMGMDECHDDEWWLDSTGETVSYITHWMHLPEPPKEG